MSVAAPPITSAMSTAGRLRCGRGDPTMVCTPGEIWRAAYTPDGPGSVRVRPSAAGVQAEGYGPGGGWLVGMVPGMLGALDHPAPLPPAHPAVVRAEQNHPHLRIPRSSTPYPDALIAVISQRITSREAARQWRALVLRLGQPAPGPHPVLRLPPDPRRLARQPSWWFHPLGVERGRAETLKEVARHADLLWQLLHGSSEEATRWLMLLRGVGIWTAASVTGSALGCPDALAVGDYHLKNLVAHALAGHPRGTDDEMVALLAPYAGQRHRVIRLLMADGWWAPAFGPRRRVLPMHRW